MSQTPRAYPCGCLHDGVKFLRCQMHRVGPNALAQMALDWQARFEAREQQLKTLVEEAEEAATNGVSWERAFFREHPSFLPRLRALLGSEPTP